MLQVACCYFFRTNYQPELSTHLEYSFQNLPATLHVPSCDTRQFLADRSLWMYLLAARYAMPSATSAAMLTSSFRVGAGFLSAS